MEAYKSWVRRNHQWLGSIESIANTMTWLLPERLASSELAPEAVSTMVGLVTLMNQRIVDTAPASVPPWIHTTSSSSSSASDNAKFPWAMVISVVKELEVLVEMSAEQYKGKDGKWTIVAAMEAVKALLRLQILYSSGCKMLLDGGETDNTEDLSNPSHCDPASGQCSRPEAPPGRAMQAFLKFGDSVPVKPSWTLNRREDLGGSQRYQGAVRQREISPASAAPRSPVPKLLVLAEIMCILRPLMYVILIRRHGLTSWKPWLTSLAVDISGLGLLYSTSLLAKKQRGGAAFSAAETQELKRRQLLWALYLLRNPFFDKYTKQELERVERFVRPLPLFGTLAGKAMDLLTGVQSIYSYTSGS